MCVCVGGLYKRTAKDFYKVRRISSDICLFLGEVDLVAQAQGHPLWKEGPNADRHIRHITHTLDTETLTCVFHR